MIRVKHVIYYYQDLTLNYDFTIPKGQLVAVLGPSGAGKSTLLNLLAGFITPDSGQIYLNQQDMTCALASQRPLTMLFQEHNLFPHLTIQQNIGLGLSPAFKLTTNDQQQIELIAEQMGITDYLYRKPHQLSGGQRQRAALARCLIQNRPILLLDEPFSALDFQRKQEMYQLLTDIHQQHQKTILMVTHDHHDVQQLAERAIIIEQGHITYDGKIEGVVANC